MGHAVSLRGSNLPEMRVEAVRPVVAADGLLSYPRIMGDRDQEKMLGEAARHRGFRLLKSRRRKPGRGDFGKYGLADVKTGKQCFGYGRDGLTATSEEVEAYLRSEEATRWKQSIGTAPRRRERKERGATAVDAKEAPITAENEGPRRPAEKARRKAPATKPAPPPQKPKAEARLRIRKAVTADKAALLRLLAEVEPGQRPQLLAARLDLLARARQPVLVADRDEILGCATWNFLRPLHGPPIGRLTTLFVTRSARRQGIGTALADAAEEAMKAQGCVLFEAVGEIDFSGAQSFFRRRGYDRRSYRFAKPAADKN